MLNQANLISNHQPADANLLGKQFASQRVSGQLGLQLRDRCSGACVKRRDERRLAQTLLQLGRKCLLGITALLLHAEQNEQNPAMGLFIAVQFLDYIWATLVLLGIEKLRVIKGFTAGSMLDSYFHPYSHSLITAILWSVVAALIYKAI